MTLWIYKGLTPEGRRLQGYIHEPSEEGAQALLSTQNVLVMSLAPTPGWRRLALRYQHRITLQDLVSLFQHALYLCQSGAALPQWLKILAEQHRQSSLYPALCHLRDRVLQGVSLFHSLTVLKDVLDDVVMSLMHQGEQTGQLEHALKTVVEHLRWQLLWRQTWSQKARYPLILCVVVSVMLMVFSLGVVPHWKQLFEALHIPLGLWTQGVLVMMEHVPWLLGGVVVMAGGVSLYSMISRRSWLSLSGLFVPGMRKFLEHRALYSWCHTMAMGLQSGMALLDCVALSVKVAKEPFRSTVEQLHQALKQGLALSQALSRCDTIPHQVVTLVYAAEHSHNLAQCFHTLTKMYAEALEHRLHKGVQMIEPVVLLVLGTVIATLVLGMLYPLYHHTGQGW